ncbi:MAG: ABC transporter ATP-binding protein [Syntrophorhabdales bacterium]|jgi:branched-chain amino acid transport system ATP-binding protein
MMVELSGVSVHYGLVQALSEINLNVKKGEIVTLLGPNSAGKTTLMCAIAGVLPLTNGEILFRGRPIHTVPTEEIIKLGITLVPEGRLLFGAMKTSENLELGAYHRWGRKQKREIEENLAEVFKIFPTLKERRNQMAGTLSGGQQQMVAIGRGLMSRPQVLLLDEPSLGLAPLMVKQLMDTLSMLREQGLTILLSEQNAEAALSIADRGYVMGGGKILFEGSSEQLRSTDKIRAAYLG